MYLATILVVSLFAQCNAYQPSSLRRLGTPASSSFAINHQTPSLPGWLTRLHVNNLICPSHSPWRLFSTADKEGRNNLTFSSLDFSSNQTVFDFVNKVVEDMARAGIPEEIKNNQYASERALLIDLEKLGLDDLEIILNQDGFPTWREMVGSAHIGAVGEIIDSFDEWKNGRPIKCRTKVNIFVNDSFNRPPNEKRCPDFAIFGPDRLEGHRIRVVNGDHMNPYIIIQFSWTNNIDNKKCAVDDMMHYAGIGEYHHLGRPNVAYLSTALRRGTSPEAAVYGFDVFQVGQDQLTPDEPAMRYRVGGQEDIVIRIMPASMGLADDKGESFTIELSDIREALELLNITFVPALGHAM